MNINKFIQGDMRVDNNNFEQETIVEKTQPNNNQQSYNQPNYGGPNLEPAMTLGDWLITLLVLSIPCVNIIMFFVWGFGSGGNTSRKNYCRAALVFALIGIVISVIFSSAIAALMVSLINSGMYY